MGFTPRQPDFAGDGVAIWKAVVDKGINKGKTYLKVKVLKGATLNCFEVEPKDEKSETSETDGR